MNQTIEEKKEVSKKQIQLGIFLVILFIGGMIFAEFITAKWGSKNETEIGEITSPPKIYYLIEIYIRKKTQIGKNIGMHLIY